VPFGVFPEGNLRCPPITGQATLVQKCVAKPIREANQRGADLRDRARCVMATL
jgi:hypothetical protein